ncbi:MAG: translation elongation factor Ts [Actinobacteria bacterium]|nr:translation elongation factor Ts [Actinomycetota bacterium]
MEITAKMVKDLRESTGAGMMDCKCALVDSCGDMEKAVDILRTKGLAALAKKAGRATDEGIISGWTSDAADVGAMIEINCETDFVARNSDFQSFGAQLASHVGISAPTDVSQMLEQPFLGGGETVERTLGEMVGRVGENITISRFARYALSSNHGAISVYIHGIGNIGVLLEVSCSSSEATEAASFKELGRNLAMQIAATAPVAVSRDEISQEIVEHELTIYKAQAAESGKPVEIQEKMAVGRIEKFYKEVALLEQIYVKDDSMTVEQYVKSVAKELGAEASIVRFERFALGGGRN